VGAAESRGLGIAGTAIRHGRFNTIDAEHVPLALGQMPLRKLQNSARLCEPSHTDVDR